jgi:hypothetical protein
MGEEEGERRRESLSNWGEEIESSGAPTTLKEIKERRTKRIRII